MALVVSLNFFQFIHGQAERLFNKHVLSRTESLEHIARMGVVASGHEDRIDTVRVEDFSLVARAEGETEPLSRGTGARTSVMSTLKCRKRCAMNSS